MGTIGTAEAAERLGVTQHQVGHMIRTKKLKAQRVGRTWIIDERSLRAVENRPGPGRPSKKSK